MPRRTGAGRKQRGHEDKKDGDVENAHRQVPDLNEAGDGSTQVFLPDGFTHAPFGSSCWNAQEVPQLKPFVDW